VKLHINPDFQPTCQPHRRVPFHIRQKVETELQKLENDDVIETITGSTPWISPIVTPPNPKDPDKVRICVDMRQANTAIQRERHITPTIDNVIQELNGAKVFSKLDPSKMAPRMAAVSQAPGKLCSCSYVLLVFLFFYVLDVVSITVYERHASKHWFLRRATQTGL